MEATIIDVPGHPDAEALSRALTPSAPKSRCVKQLHARLSGIEPSKPLPERIEALELLARWVVDGPAPPATTLGETESAATQRLRLLVRALEVAPAFQHDLAETVRSIVAETSSVALLCESGLPNPRGVWTESADRVARRLLPVPADHQNLAELLFRMFRSRRDVQWLAEVPGELCAALARQLGGALDPLLETTTDAVRILATRVSAHGLAGDIRKRSPDMPVRESPFFLLPTAAHDEMAALADACRSHVAVVHEKLEQHGVSVDVVYRLDLIELTLTRIEKLVDILRAESTEQRSERVARLAHDLCAARLQDRSLRDLVSDNTRLLARKIIERAGETGEHYITTTRREWWMMIASAGGGGVLTTGTCTLKFLTKWGHFPLFVDGFLSSANYAASFILMQLLGFTLATKQPSMTAAAIAAAIHGSAGRHDLGELVTMISRVCRSQLAAAIGNIGLVIPTSIAFQLLYVNWAGKSFLDEESATATIASFHPLESGTIPFAAFTGVLLWMSSLGAGWLENWTAYRRLPEGIATHRWGRVVGRRTTRFFGRFLTKHVAGFGGNLTLGILLGMIPVLAKFFGLPLDVRHVTLSTGGLTLALCAVGPSALATEQVLAAMGGIAIIGMLNFGVSFVLALAVAFRAREVRAREALQLFVEVVKRLFTAPTEFFFPPRVELVPVRATAHHPHH